MPAFLARVPDSIARTTSEREYFEYLHRFIEGGDSSGSDSQESLTLDSFFQGISADDESSDQQDFSSIVYSSSFSAVEVSGGTITAYDREIINVIADTVINLEDTPPEGGVVKIRITPGATATVRSSKLINGSSELVFSSPYAVYDFYYFITSDDWGIV